MTAGIAELAGKGVRIQRLLVRFLTSVSETMSSVLVFGWALALLALVDLILVLMGWGGN